MLREYQQRAIDQLYFWFSKNETGNPCLVLPTGAGKSHIVAALCKDALQNWPETRVMMLTHVKELIEQNAEKMRQHWPNAPMGIYSASIGKRDLDEPITFAGIQSVRNKSKSIGHVDLIIVDECHLISHKSEGAYRDLIAELKLINPALRVIGLTATPFRLGHGYIHQGDNVLFNALIEPVGIEELIFKKYLAPLKSKITGTQIDVIEVKKKGGEYIESELQNAVDTKSYNKDIVSEVIERSEGRLHWLFFCTGVDHAEHVKEELINHNISAACITGATSKTERAKLIKEFKSGKITALTNANVLTTGFDYPDIDLIAMLRPTLSPGLYVQMAGRGLRPKSHTDHCLVLDFAGIVQMHGPITAVNPPKKKGEKSGDAPVKLCDNCNEICHASVKICPACGFAFPIKDKSEDLFLRNSDIMGAEPDEMKITSWGWSKHVSRSSGFEMLKVTYYGNLSDPPITEYLTVLHEGYAGERARLLITSVARKSGIDFNFYSDDLENVAAIMNENAKYPDLIKYRKQGKFYQVIDRQWTSKVINIETELFL